MNRRNCQEVIMNMINKIPSEHKDFIKDLQWNYEDAAYKAPEETIQWERTQETLIKHIPSPTTDWEFEVLSEFTTRTIDELKTMVK